MMRVFTATSGRRSGKSLYGAAIVAAHLKSGGSAVLMTANNGGNVQYPPVECEPIVGVPGFDDGRQITDQRS